MRTIITILFLILTTGVWAGGWSGADMWSDTPNKAERVFGFKSGYVDTVSSKFPWSSDDLKLIGMWYLALDEYKVAKDVDAFYAIPENKEVPANTALRICLERLIAKTPDGPRLLAAIGVDVKKLR